MYTGLNECSLHGQLADSEVVPFLTAVLQCRDAIRGHGEALRCRRTLLDRPLVGSMTMGEILRRLPAQDSRKRLCLSWLQMEGPFLEDDLLHHIGCEYQCAGELVTDGILAELAHRQHHGISTPTAAVSATPSVMDSDPLAVRLEEGTRTVDVSVRNFVRPESLRAWLSSLEPPLRSWEDLERRARGNCPCLRFADDAFAPLRPLPFVAGAAKRLLDLLHVLQRLKGSFDETGALSPDGQRLRQMHFTGDKAWFTDSSDTEKSDFKDELTFPHPDRPGDKLFCAWHGKVKTPQLRIHFSFPISRSDTLYLVYVGPKITKR